MKFIDAHIHLTNSPYPKDISKIIYEAEKLGVLGIITNSVDLKTSQQSLKLAEKFPKQVYSAIGIHPWNTKKLKSNEVKDTVDLILKNQKNQKLVAIGEIGLDATYSETGEPTLLQNKVFREMLLVAEKTSLPVIIHSRGSTPRIVNELSSYNIRKVLLHWYSQPHSLIPQIIDRGYYISEGPTVLYSKGIQKIIKQIPLQNLLTETDGPVRFRGPFKGKLTTPSFIPLIVEAIADLKGIKKNQVANKIFDNFVDFFNLLSVRDKRHDEGTIHS